MLDAMLMKRREIFSEMLTAPRRWAIAMHGLVGLKNGESSLKKSTDVVSNSHAQIEVPEGWALVPLEPTQKMIEAGIGALYRHIAALPDEVRYKHGAGNYRISKRHKFKIRWKAMFDAAPRVRE
jgi:hypothetical protein